MPGTTSNHDGMQRENFFASTLGSRREGAAALSVQLLEVQSIVNAPGANTRLYVKLLAVMAVFFLSECAHGQLDLACHTNLPIPGHHDCSKRSSSSGGARLKAKVSSRVRAILYKPVFFHDDIDDKDGTISVGACIYLGATRQQPDPDFEYNWEQIYKTNMDDHPERCALDEWHKDPCPDVGDPSPLYRTTDRSDFTDKNPVVKNSWNTAYLFRDLPRRRLKFPARDFTSYAENAPGLVVFNAHTGFVGVPKTGDPVVLVEGISFGFSIQPPHLILHPLRIDGMEIVPEHSYDLRSLRLATATLGNTDPCIATQADEHTPVPNNNPPYAVQHR